MVSLPGSKRGRGRPPKNITILKMLWGGYPSIKAMREAEARKRMKKAILKKVI